MPTLGSSRASNIVIAAIKAGRLPPITDKTICVDCGKRANAYDHRDYNKPLEVEPVCHRCNNHRGPAIPVTDKNIMDGMERINFYLSEVQIKKLKDLAKKTGLSVSELARRAFDFFLDHNKRGGK